MNRLDSFHNALSSEGLDGILVSSLPNITYLTGFTEFDSIERNAFLLISQNKKYIFTHGIYKEAVQKEISGFQLIDINRENPIGKKLSELVSKLNIKKLGFESSDLSFSEYENIKKHLPKTDLISTFVTQKLRKIKDSLEIQNIKKACDLGDSAFSYIIKKLSLEMSEMEIAADLEYYMKSKLETNPSFEIIIAIEKNASRPHHVPGKAKLKKGNLILLDFGIRFKGYCSDMTRTVFFGEVSHLKQQAYETVQKAQEKAAEYINEKLLNNEPIYAAEADRISREFILKNGFPNLPHSLGHGIGLQVHESPRLSPISKDILTEGMIFSIEPGIYLPDHFGIRIEDLYAIQKNGLIKI